MLKRCLIVLPCIPVLFFSPFGPALETAPFYFPGEGAALAAVTLVLGGLFDGHGPISKLFGTAKEKKGINPFAPVPADGISVALQLTPIGQLEGRYVQDSQESLPRFVANPNYLNDVKEVLGEDADSPWLDPKFLAAQYQRQTGQVPDPATQDLQTTKSYMDWLFKQPEYVKIYDKIYRRLQKR